MNTESSNSLAELTAEIVAAYVGSNTVSREDIPKLITDVHAALVNAPKLGSESAPETQEPAVSIRRSVTPDAIVCLEDGKKFKSLRRHLQSDHGLTPEQYRAKWNLKRDYPMVAPNYAKARSELAKSLGLGRKPSDEVAGRDGKAPGTGRRGRPHAKPPPDRAHQGFPCAGSSFRSSAQPFG
jgi:predicted transcriptional regulator